VVVAVDVAVAGAEVAAVAAEAAAAAVAAAAGAAAVSEAAAYRGAAAVGVESMQFQCIGRRKKVPLPGRQTTRRMVCAIVPLRLVRTTDAPQQVHTLDNYSSVT
jgi:hypothetical protein